MIKTKTLVGYKRFTSKKGNPLCLAVILNPFDEKSNERGSFGCDCEQVFVPAEQYDYLTVNDIGLPVETRYDVINGRAYLREIIVARKEAK